MLVVTDLHLTDRDRDEYRWDLFPWLAQQLRDRDDNTLLILGDLTDSKDGHSAKLVNRIIDTLVDLPAHVFVLKGNHDYTDAECPFFRFLSGIAYGGKLEFISEPKWLFMVDSKTRKPDLTRSTLMLPHTRTPAEDWESIDIEGVDVICCHQTFNGADAGGYLLSSGISAEYWSKRGFDGLVLSGDIHVRQHIGDIEYVGCPYPVAFGDNFKPRILQVLDDKVKSIPVPSIQRVSLDLADVNELLSHDLHKGDQAKVRVHLPRSEFGAWDDHKSRLMAHAKDLGVRLYSVELVEKRRRSVVVDGTKPAAPKPSAAPKDVLGAFCEARGLDDSLQQTAADFLRR